MFNLFELCVNNWLNFKHIGSWPYWMKPWLWIDIYKQESCNQRAVQEATAIIAKGKWISRCKQIRSLLRQKREVEWHNSQKRNQLRHMNVWAWEGGLKRWWCWWCWYLSCAAVGGSAAHYLPLHLLRLRSSLCLKQN